MSNKSWTEDEISDEDVFFGKLSLEEIKKHILWNEHNFYAKYSSSAPRENYCDDIKIIQTHSAPDLIQRNKAPCSEQKKTSSVSLSPTGPEVYSDWEVKTVDDSFLKVEKMVAEMCVSPKKGVKKEELNNTLDIIDYILKNGPPHAVKNIEQQNESCEQSTSKKVVKTKIPTIDVDSTETECKHSVILKNKMLCKTDNLPASFTPVKSVTKQKKIEKFVTPSDFKHRAPVFKTPTNPLSAKIPSVTSLKKTPNKNAPYQHIASPVASYIKNCPVAPLVKEVRPTKPLPSSIPKFVKNPVLHKPSNKENMNLPSVAYKSARETQVIKVPDDQRLPQSHLMKKITSSLPKPLIMKHDHREMNLAKRLLTSRRLEDSFGDLSLRQADISVCTQKSAFCKP